MKLFAGLRKIREIQRQQLPFLKSIIDFDIIIEIGFAEEQGRPLNLKQLFLLNICARTTLRRKLAILIDNGFVVRRKHDNDGRASFLIIASSGVKMLTKYSGGLSAIAASHFKLA